MSKNQEQEVEVENEWMVTHKGWFLLCPVWLAECDEDDVPTTPIPRRQWLCEWLDLMIWLNHGIMWVVASFAPERAGFYFWAVKELKEPVCWKC